MINSDNWTHIDCLNTIVPECLMCLTYFSGGKYVRPLFIFNNMSSYADILRYSSLLKIFTAFKADGSLHSKLMKLTYNIMASQFVIMHWF